MWTKSIIFLSLASSLLWVGNPLLPENAKLENQSAIAQPKELKKIKVNPSWLLQGDNAGLIVAIQKGYFTAEGLDVSWERGYGSADTLSKVASGQFEFGFGDMYSMIEFNAKNPNDALVAVAAPYNKSPFAIISLKKSGIKSPKDLAGKKLGAPVGDAPRRLWRAFAAEVGIPANSVEWITMEPRLRETFLVKGDVNAISGFVTTILPSLNKIGAKPQDLNVFYYSENGLDLYGNGIIVKQSFLKANPQVVRGFLKAYLRGQQDMLKDPVMGLESVVKAGDSLMDKESEKKRLQIALERLFISPEVQKVGLGGVDLARLEKTIKDVAEDFNLTPPKVNQVFDGSFLPPLAGRQLPPASARKPLL
jgi:NitT/TauT family transport system substrate-binding protein